MKKRLSIFIVVGIMMFSTTCFASLAEELDNNPNYIHYGGVSIGVAFYMDKTSINVHKYEPPIYIIAFTNLTYKSGAPHEGFPENVTYSTKRYKYNYDTRQMYCETKKANGEIYWEYIDPNKATKGYDYALLSGGEIAFYLAYNMSFYDEPISFVVKKYINSHK